MNVNRITENVLKGIEEETTSVSISYLPGSFDTAKSLVNDLSRIKTRWGIEILENEDSYVLMFEDALSISIPREHYGDFNKNVLPVEGVAYVDLTKIISESIKEFQQEVYGRLQKALLSKLKSNKHISSSTVLMKHWLHVFPNSKFVASGEKVAIKLNDFDNGAKKLSSELEKLHGDDIGEIDSIVDAIEEGRPIGSLENYDYVAGIKIQSRYGGVNLLAEFNVNFAMICSQSIYIDNVDVLDELEGYSSIKVLYRRIFPVGHEFRPSIFGNIKSVIENET